MKKILIFCLTVLNSIVVADSHSDMITQTITIKNVKSKKSDSFFKIGGGVYYQPMDEFNDALLKKDISSLDNTIPLVAIGFYSLSKRYRYGLDFDIIWSKSAKAKTETNPISGVQMRGFSAIFNNGVNLLKNPQFGIQPMLGIGFFRHTYDFHAHFDDVLNREIDEDLKIRNRGVVLSGSVNIHFHSKMKEEKLGGEDIPMIMGIDLEGGVNYYPVRKLKYLDNTIIDGPKMSKYGVFAKLSISFGGKHNNKKEKKNREEIKECFDEIFKEFCKECCKE